MRCWPNPVVAACGLTVLLHLPMTAKSQTRAKAVRIDPASLPRLATVDERYQSYNVEMAEVIGGNFWKPYSPASIAAMKARATAAKDGATAIASPAKVGVDTTIYEARPPIELTNARLRRLAAALGPAYVRVSGSWANEVYFHDENTPAPATAPSGFTGVLTRAEWKGVIEFAHAVNAQLVSSFAISAGVRDVAGVWTPVQARKLIAYTGALGGAIVAAEMFNEPNMPTYAGAPAGYTAESYARDFAAFESFIRSAAPDMRIVGPGSVGEGILMPLLGEGGFPGYVSTESILGASPRPVSDIFSYHTYPAVSIRCASMGVGAQTTPEAALTEEWLSRTDRSYAFYVSGLRDRFEPGKPVWITETADAACGGNPWAKTFLDTFRYLDQMGRLARRGVNVIFHNTLASSEYGLLDQNTFEPRPDYWAALLWRRLMDTTVLDAGPSRLGLHLYAHCLRGHPGGVTLLAINNSRTEPSSIEVPVPAERYTFSARQLQSGQVDLNGHPLFLGADDSLPQLRGAPVPAGLITLAPSTISFLTMASAANGMCR